MIIKNIVKQPKSIVEVQITVPWTDLESKWNEVLGRMAQEVELSGFRKGQAPLPMVEQHLGSKLQDEVFRTVFPVYLVEALQGSSIVPIDYPRYQLVSFAKNAELVFRSQITEKPEVKVGEYKTIQVPRTAAKVVTDEDVNKLVEDLFKRWKAKQQSANGSQPTAAQGNQGNGSISFNGQAGGPVLSTSTHSTNAQGRTELVERTTTLSTEGGSIATSDIPDDAFAGAMGAANLTDLKGKIRADLENEAKFNNELDYEESILQEVEKITTVEIPQVLIEDELNRMLVSLQKRVSDMGLLVEEYLKSQNETLEGLRAKWLPQAEKNVRMELGLAEIARQENVDITEAELQAEIDKIQDAKLKAQFEAQEPKLHLRHSLRQMKTLDLLKTLVKSA